MARPRKYSPEVRERAIRMVREHGPEHPSVGGHVDREQVRLYGETPELGATPSATQRSGLTTDERQRLKELERDNRELKRANDILRKASAFCPGELDRRVK